jgi:hypothetical protein
MTVKPKASQSTDSICCSSQYIYQIQPVLVQEQLLILHTPGSLPLPLFKVLMWIFLASVLLPVSPHPPHLFAGTVDGHLACGIRPRQWSGDSDEGVGGICSQFEAMADLANEVADDHIWYPEHAK